MHHHSDLVLLGKALTNHKYKVVIEYLNSNYHYVILVFIRADGRHLRNEVSELPASIWGIGELVREMVKGADGKAKHGFYR